MPLRQRKKVQKMLRAINTDDKHGYPYAMERCPNPGRLCKEVT